MMYQVMAYPVDTTEALCDDHVSVFSFLGCVPRNILYDNTRLAVAKIPRPAYGALPPSLDFTSFLSNKTRPPQSNRCEDGVTCD